MHSSNLVRYAHIDCKTEADAARLLQKDAKHLGIYFEVPRLAVREAIPPEGCMTMWLTHSKWATEEGLTLEAATIAHAARSCSDIKDLFRDCGIIRRVSRSKGDTFKESTFSHVDFEDPSAAIRAVKLTGTKIKGVPVRIDFTDGQKACQKPRSPKPPGPCLPSPQC